MEPELTMGNQAKVLESAAHLLCAAANLLVVGGTEGKGLGSVDSYASEAVDLVKYVQSARRKQA